MHRESLTLDNGARGVQDARRWVVEVCRHLARPDLADSAELAVSELVTNAVLHGRAPVRLTAGGTPEHPRLEVYDASPVPPQPPSADGGAAIEFDLDAFDEDDPGGLDAMVTFGRGLALVARASVAWGADIEEDGKTVWFEPAVELAEDEGAPYRLCERGARPEPETEGDQITVHVRGVPVAAFGRFQRHFRELRREVRLLALAHEDDYPLAKTLSEYFDALEVPLRRGLGREQADAARVAGRSTVDLELGMPVASARQIGALGRVLDAADEFCRSERLLTLARSEEQRRFQTWFVGEFDRQARGEEPTAWHDARPTIGG